MKKYLLLFFIIFACLFSVYSDDNPSIQKNTKKIKSKLKKIENEFITELDFEERRDAVSLIDDIIKQLDKIEYKYEKMKEENKKLQAKVDTIEEEEENKEVIKLISKNELSILLKNLDRGSTSEQNNQIAMYAVQYHFEIDDVVKVIDQLSFDDDKLDAINLLLPKVVDKTRVYKLFDQFKFSSSKEKLGKMIDNYVN